MADKGKDKQVTFGIVVLAYGQFERLVRPCVDSLLSQLGESDDLLLVDNHSPDGTGSAAADYSERHPRCRFQQNSGNFGYSGGMNSGAANLQGDWLLLVNSDTVFPAGTLTRWRDLLAGISHEVGMVGPASNAAGTGQQIGLGDQSLEEVLAFGSRLALQPTRLLFDVYRIDFFCVAIRRATWDELGGLDESFGMGYYEDFDFSLRAREAGWRQLVSDDLLVAHVGSASFGSKSKRQTKLMKANKALLMKKHRRVRFEHQREGNLAILEQYDDHLAGVSADVDALRVRIETRLAELARNQPRGLLKRIRWQYKTQLLCGRLRGSVGV